MLKWCLIALGAVLVLALAGLAAVPWLVDTPRIQAYIAQAASQALGRPVRFAALSVSAFPLPAVRLRGLSVAEDPRFGSGAFLTVADGRVRIKLGPLLVGRVELADVTLDGLRLVLVEDAGQWNLATLGAGGGGRAAARGGAPSAAGGSAGGTVGGATAFSRVRVVNGTVQYWGRGRGPADLRLERVSLTMEPGPRPDLVRVVGEAESWPGQIRIRLEAGAVTLSPGRPLSEAAVSGSIHLEARDLGSLGALILAVPEVSGPLAGTVRLRGTLGRLLGEGELRTSRLVLSQARPHCGAPSRRELALERLHLPLTFAATGVEMGRVRVHAGGGTVSLHLGLRLWPAPVATASGIVVTAVELKPILADYACLPYAVAGPLDLAGEASLDPGDPWRTLRGHGRFRVGRGRVVGRALVDLIDQAAAVARRGAPGVLSELRTAGALPTFDSIAGTYRIADGVLSTRDLAYESGELHAAAVGTYRLSDGRVDAAVTLAQGATRMRARVSGVPSGLAVAPTGIMRGDAGGPAAGLDRPAR